MCCSRSFFLVIFGALFLAIFLERFQDLFLRDSVGDVCMNPSWFFSFVSPPKSVSKGARFWGFFDSLDLASFGGQKLGYGLPMRCSYYPQSLAQIRGAIREIGSWFWGS
jgi:hypothetical protein